jgi:hypothetical protein
LVFRDSLRQKAQVLLIVNYVPIEFVGFLKGIRKRESF